MKNNILSLLFYILLNFNNILLSDEFSFDSKRIEISKEKNLIIAYSGKAITSDENLEIKAEKFIYEKNSDLLRSMGNGQAIVKSEDIKIKFDNAIFDQRNKNILANKNVELFSINNNLIIRNDEMFYDLKNNILSSNKTTKIEDNKGNIHYVDSFIFEIKKDLIKVWNLVTQDNKSNIYQTSIAYLNIKSGKIFGKDISVELKNSSNTNSKNYRFKGNSVEIDDSLMSISKGVFTTCEKRENCSPWTFSADKIKHEKKDKTITYENAILRIYNKPIAYFPKFFHPDPTVERKSGFLIPSLTSVSNSDNFLNVPFFYVISENKDFTFNPRFYGKEKFLLQSEYRQKNFDNDHIIDFSIYNSKKSKSKNHFFYKFDKNLTSKNFDTGKLDLKIQQTSDDKYLKSNKIKSAIYNDTDILENSLDLEFYSNDLSININSTIYEDLNKINSDRFEYIFPKVSITKNLNEILNLNGNFLIKSNAEIRQFNTNVIEKENINDFIFNSGSKISNFGFLNSHQFLIRNTNIENKNSNYKNKKNLYLSSIYQYNSILPLIKNGDKFQNIFKPRVSLRLAPKHTKNQSKIERKTDITNIYSLNRMTDNKSIEGGFSMIYGLEYSAQNKSKDIETLNLKIANNLRFKENKKLSGINQMDEKTSNIFNEILFNANENVTLKYTSSIKNNLKNMEYENLRTKFNFKKFLTEFDYTNENNTFDKNSYLLNKSQINLNKNNNFQFTTRKNKTKNLTEYYNLMYQFKNDCLSASIEFNKDFYNDGEIKPQKNILFKLTISPFAQFSSPNIAK